MPGVVRYWSYEDEYHRHRGEILGAVDRVFSSGRLILGPEVEAFEREWAARVGARFGVGVNSGTDALFLGLRALGVGAGDEVVTVANTAVPTVAALRATGALPVFVDVEEDTGLLDLERLPEALGPKTRCIVPVHLYGQAVDMEALLALAGAAGVPVLEDCAQAAGATSGGLQAGSAGALGAFSFYPTKVLGAYGDAGMCVTSSEELAHALRRLRFYGMEGGAYVSLEEGFNSRLDEVQAAILRTKLAGLDEAASRRRSLAARYHEALEGVGDLGLPFPRPGRTHQYYVYTVRTGRRDELREHLLARGIETRINYPVPIHLMPAYAFLGLGPGALPVTERLAGRILSLPLYPDLPTSSQDRVVEAIREFFGA